MRVPSSWDAVAQAVAVGWGQEFLQGLASVQSGPGVWCQVVDDPGIRKAQRSHLGRSSVWGVWAYPFSHSMNVH